MKKKIVLATFACASLMLATPFMAAAQASPVAASAGGATAVEKPIAAPGDGHEGHTHTHTTQATTGTPPTWEEFLKATHVDPDGQYIVNGDVPMPNIVALKEFYTQMVSPTAPGEKTNSTDLAANTDRYGYMTLWNNATAGNLTYCISNDFGSDKAAMVNVVAQATAVWENASSNINFVYNSSQDSYCDTSNPYVLFSIEPTQSNSYVARAFFPNTAKAYRNVLVDDSIWYASVGAKGIMAHELGHTLGFRHEQTRPEAGACYEDNYWQALTPYDSVSIMHYPQCNGDNNGFDFSYWDEIGTQRAYGY